MCFFVGGSHLIIKFYRVRGVGGKRHLNWYFASVVCCMGILVPRCLVGNLAYLLQKEFRGDGAAHAAVAA